MIYNQSGVWTLERIILVVESIRDKTGYQFDDNEVRKVLEHTKRKCKKNGCSESYLPILFENELRDYASRTVINKIGEMNRCAKFATETRA